MKETDYQTPPEIIVTFSTIIWGKAQKLISISSHTVFSQRPNFRIEKRRVLITSSSRWA